MSKWTEAAMKVRPLYQKGAQSLSDEEALIVKNIYAEWEAGVEVKYREKRIYKGKLYRCTQTHITQADWTPAVTPALWTILNENNAGSITDPIPAESGLEYEYGLYYRDPTNNNIYLCERQGEPSGGKITLYALPHQLVGNYFTLVEVTE